MVSHEVQNVTFESYPELLTVEELAKILKVSPRTVWRMESAGNVPKPIRIGKTVRWLAADVKTFLSSRGQSFGT